MIPSHSRAKKIFELAVKKGEADKNKITEKDGNRKNHSATQETSKKTLHPNHANLKVPEKDCDPKVDKFENNCEPIREKVLNEDCDQYSTPKTTPENESYLSLLDVGKEIVVTETESPLIVIEDEELRDLIESNNFRLDDYILINNNNSNELEEIGSTSTSDLDGVSVVAGASDDPIKFIEKTRGPHENENNVIGEIFPTDPNDIQSENPALEETININENGYTHNNIGIENNNDSQDVNYVNPQEVDENREEEIEITLKGRRKKGRKRKYEEQTRDIKKKRVNFNKDYINTKGEITYSKEFRDYHCNCKLKCNVNVSLDHRKTIFSNFQRAGSFEARTQIIQGLVREVPLKRKRNKNSNTKMSSREYYLNDTKVCKAIFIQTLRTSSCVIDRAVKLKRNCSVIKDGRGSAGGHNKHPESKIQEVIQHILKFPRYVSHYSRSTTEAEYLHPDTTVKVMYELYSNEHENPVSYAKYKSIFLNKFNLKRKALTKDTCSVCDRFMAQIKGLDGENQASAKTLHEDHLTAAKDARDLMNRHFAEAKENRDRECLSFDLEKTLPLPRIPTNIIYYKRQLCFYNCGIHNSQGTGFCYTWVEGCAGRGAQEVGSCLRLHILNYVPQETKYLNLWSDSCGGQNRNIKILLILKTVLESHPGLEVITQHYLVPGHSFLKNDSDFSDIEKGLKLQQRLYLPVDYESIIEKCRKKNPLRVTSMTCEDFVSTEDLEKSITNRKVNTLGGKVNWFKFRVIEVRKSHPMSVFVKTNLNQQNFEEINVLKKKGRQSIDRPNTLFFTNKLKKLWPNGKPISRNKLEDIKSMFPLIPKDCLPFYKNLTGSNEVADDIEGFGCGLDFDLEDEQ